jgi:putative acetyltransferase
MPPSPTLSARFLRNGLTADKGYTVADPNLDELFELYSQPGSAYWVVEQEGGWLAAAALPLAHSEPDICELQKMYFMTSPAARAGEKAGAAGVGLCPRAGFQTLLSGNHRLPERSRRLYEHLGFEHIDGRWAAPVTWIAKCGC